MESPVKQPHNDALKQLLEEGTKSYLEAATALIAFQGEVQKKCRAVIENNRTDYAAALKVALSDDEIQSFAAPEFAKWESDWWSLGVKVVRKDFPKLRWWEMQCCLEFEISGEAYLSCSITEWFPTTKMAGEVFAQFSAHDTNVRSEGKGVWLQIPVEMQDVAIFDEKLDALCRQWIDLWKKAGGIKEVFKGW